MPVMTYCSICCVCKKCIDIDKQLKICGWLWTPWFKDEKRLKECPIL